MFQESPIISNASVKENEVDIRWALQTWITQYGWMDAHLKNEITRDDSDDA